MSRTKTKAQRDAGERRSKVVGDRADVRREKLGLPDRSQPAFSIAAAEKERMNAQGRLEWALKSVEEAVENVRWTCANLDLVDRRFVDMQVMQLKRIQSQLKQAMDESTEALRRAKVRLGEAP